ncbi:MAG: propionyl-CoA carboxylase [Candidatus Lambdaproteobacteria bacterium]|nr:propionyl-CoA carboxylase [Candidatus Lambdaproteobacteria bacterium]
MSWLPEVEELNRRKGFAEAMGGEEAVARHKRSGKHTARERIGLLFDPGTFREVGVLTGKGQYDEEARLLKVTPTNVIIGKGRIGGRKVVATVDDYTIRGGSSESTIAEKWVYGERLAYELRLPLVRLIDSAGGSVKLLEMMGATKIPGYPTWPRSRMMGLIPIVGIALGSCAGNGAKRVAWSHFSLMVKGQAQVFAAGPVVVEPGVGQELTKEELGGYLIHTRGSGLIDNEAESEQDAFAQARRFLSYLPQNVHQLPPALPSDDDPGRREEALLSIVPRERRRVYRMRRILELVFDKESLFEIGRYNGPSTITMLGRLTGRPVAILANDPYAAGGTMTRASAQKMEAFIDLADTFHLPIVNFVDQPGVAIGLEAEKQGTMRAAIRALAAIEDSRVPFCAVIVRRAYGVAGAGHGRVTDINQRFAWPSAHWGSIPLEGGIMAAHRRELAEAADPEKRLTELEEHYARFTSPFLTAEKFAIQDIVDPRETRPLLCDWVEDAYALLPQQLGPSGRGYRK